MFDCYSYAKQGIIVFSQITTLIKTFNSDLDPEQISLGIAFAMVVGLTPFWSLHNLLVLFLAMILRANLAVFLAAIAPISLLAYLLDPLFHYLGFFVLKLEMLEGVWVMLYNSSLWRIENFNNTIVMGSLLFCLLFFIPAYLGSVWIIGRYRDHILAWVRKLRLRRFLKPRYWVSKIRAYIKLVKA